MSQVPKQDFTQRWEAFHWPLRLKQKQDETEKMLQEDRQLFQKEMAAQQQQFEKHLEELAFRVSNFHQYSDPARITKVVSVVHEIQQVMEGCVMLRARIGGLQSEISMREGEAEEETCEWSDFGLGQAGRVEL